MGVTSGNSSSTIGVVGATFVVVSVFCSWEEVCEEGWVEDGSSQVSEGSVGEEGGAVSSGGNAGVVGCGIAEV